MTGQQERVAELKAATVRTPEYPAGPWPTSIVRELIGYVEAEHAAREAAERLRDDYDRQSVTAQRTADRFHTDYDRVVAELADARRSVAMYESDYATAQEEYNKATDRAEAAEATIEQVREMARNAVHGVLSSDDVFEALAEMDSQSPAEQEPNGWRCRQCGYATSNGADICWSVGQNTVDLVCPECGKVGDFIDAHVPAEQETGNG